MEMDQGMSQGHDTPAPVANTPAPSQAPAPEERSFRQSDVDSIVKKAKHEAVESYRRQSTEQPQYAAQKYGEQQPEYQQRQQSSMPESDIRRMASEEAQRLRDTWVQEAQSKAEADQATRIVNNFWSKIAPGKEKYQDFDAVTQNLDLSEYPNVVQLLAEHMDNSHDVLYDLAKNPTKLWQLEAMARDKPRLAIAQAQHLSKSLQDNDAAGKIRVPNEPLSQMRPSNNGTSTGALSVKDYRARYKV